MADPHPRREPPLDRYLRAWKLVPDGPLIETPTSWIAPMRRAGEPVMLKLLKPGGDERCGASVLRHFAGRGAVRLLAADTAGRLMERAHDDCSLTAMAISGGDDRAAGILAGCIEQLHAPRDAAVPVGLVHLREWFQPLLASRAHQPVQARCAAMARHLLATEHETVVLHGDLHHDNVLHSPRGWLAIDPKGLIGERAYEVANLLCNPQPHGDIVHRPERMQRLALLYAERLNLDARRVLGFALVHAGLSAVWAIEDGRDPAYRWGCADVLASVVIPAARKTDSWGGADSPRR